MLLWDTTTGRLRESLTDRRRVQQVLFGPDGRTVATDGDGGIRLWHLARPDPAAAITTICRSVHRSLTAGERAQYLPGRPPDPECPA